MTLDLHGLSAHTSSKFCKKRCELKGLFLRMQCPLKCYKSTIVDFPGTLTMDCGLPSLFSRSEYTLRFNYSYDLNSPLSITADYPSLILLSDMIISLLPSSSSSSSTPTTSSSSTSTSLFLQSSITAIAIDNSIVMRIRLTNQQTVLQTDLVMESLSITLIDQSLLDFSLTSSLSVVCEDFPSQNLSPQFFRLSIHYPFHEHGSRTSHHSCDYNKTQLLSVFVGDVDISCTSHTISLLSDFLDFVSIFPTSYPCFTSPFAGMISPPSSPFSLQDIFPSSSSSSSSSSPLLLDILIPHIRLRYDRFCSLSLHTVYMTSYPLFLDLHTITIIAHSFSYHPVTRSHMWNFHCSSMLSHLWFSYSFLFSSPISLQTSRKLLQTISSFPRPTSFLRPPTRVAKWML